MAFVYFDSSSWKTSRQGWTDVTANSYDSEFSKNVHDRWMKCKAKELKQKHMGYRGQFIQLEWNQSPNRLVNFNIHSLLP